MESWHEMGIMCGVRIIKILNLILMYAYKYTALALVASFNFALLCKLIDELSR